MSTTTVELPADRTFVVGEMIPVTRFECGRSRCVYQFDDQQRNRRYMIGTDQHTLTALGMKSINRIAEKRELRCEADYMDFSDGAYFTRQIATISLEVGE